MTPRSFEFVDQLCSTVECISLRLARACSAVFVVASVPCRKQCSLQSRVAAGALAQLIAFIASICRSTGRELPVVELLVLHRHASSATVLALGLVVCPRILSIDFSVSAFAVSHVCKFIGVLIES